MLYTVRYHHKVSSGICRRCHREQGSHHSLHKGGPSNSEWGHGIAGDDCCGYEPELGQVADLPATVVELGDTASVARMLRSAKLLGKGEQLRDIRRERIANTAETKLVCFPRASMYHALVVEPKREAPATSGSDVVLTRHTGIYRVRWCRNGYCYVTSNVNGGLLGAYVDGQWDDKGRLPDDVRSFAMSACPNPETTQETAP